MSGIELKPPHRDPVPVNFGPPQLSRSYALSGKIMLSAIVVLFFVVILMVCLHLYARWYLLRARRRHLRRNRHNRRTHIVFHDDHSAAAVSAGARGLDVSILNSLPVFVFDSKSKSKSQSAHMSSAVADNNLEEEHPVLECAVCLSEFEDNETGRLLPKCNHSFHIECIDMWFQSHSTCPLCRAPVELGPGSETRPDVVITVSESVPGEAGPSSNSADGPRRTASFGGRVKPLGIVVPPRRNESLEDSGCGESPASQAFRSPMSRMLSFRRIMSRDRRNGGVSPSAGCSSVAESDIELGGGRQETELTRREEKQG